MKTFLGTLLLLVTLAQQPLLGQNHPRGVSCTVSRDEVEVLASYLRGLRAGPSLIVVVTTTDSNSADVDALNLQLAAQGRGIPPEARADFKRKDEFRCHIRRFRAATNVRFISQHEHDQIFRSGWREFHRRYGKGAELMTLSRVGFTSDKTLALFHISGGIDAMAAAGYLYVLERKHGQWTKKCEISDWIT
jgi:hypothetical protein